MPDILSTNDLLAELKKQTGALGLSIHDGAKQELVGEADKIGAKWWLGGAPARAAHSQQRQGRPLLVPLALFPRAERRVVRDRHRRTGLRGGRAARQARREPGAAAVLGAQAQADRGRVEAALASAGA